MSIQIERSWTNILGDIVARIQEIIRSEFQLAKAELMEQASEAGKAGALLGAGAVIGLYAGGFLLLAVMYGLEKAVPSWLAALIVTVVTAPAAMVLVNLGRKRLRRVNSIAPKTISSVRENVQWAKHQVR